MMFGARCFVLIFGLFVNVIARLVTKWEKGIFLCGFFSFILPAE